MKDELYYLDETCLGELYHFDLYQDLAEDTAVYPDRGDNIYYPALGLAGEAGEVCEKIKKIMRDQKGHLTKENAEELVKELGDVLWYVANLACEINSTLSNVAETNLRKLKDRKDRGVLKGSGDNR